MSLPTLPKIVENFPFKTLTPIIGEPNYPAINQMTQELYANASSLPSTLGGGKHGHLGLIMKDALYSSITKSTFTIPADPGPSPIYPGDKITTITHDNMTNIWSTKSYTYRCCTSMESALKAQVIEAVEEMYLVAIRNRYTAYLVVSVRDLLDHLLLRYGRISARDLVENMKTLHQPLDTGSPIDLYFKRIEDCREFSVDGNDPISGRTIVNTALTAVQSAGIYKPACKDFKALKEENKTWNNFKLVFQKEYHDLKEEELADGTQNYQVNKVENQQGFINPNPSYQDITQSLENVALSIANDSKGLESIIHANSTLIETNKKLVEENLKLKEYIKTIKTIDYGTYCWTHGYRVGRNHTSKSCSFKAEGHQDKATRKDTMGGSTLNKGWYEKGDKA